MDRRQFLKLSGAAGLGAVAPHVFGDKPSSAPPRAKGDSLVGFASKPMDQVRVGLIGVGARGPTHLNSLLAIEGAKITAICDLYPDWAERAAKRVTDAGHAAPALYTNGPDDYKRLNDRDDVDIVIISTPWDDHVPMSVDAMKKGKHAFVEVPAATTVDGCWELVDTAEQYQRHCMMLENVNYGREELLVLNMVRKGLFGEILHTEAAYIHDLRSQMHEIERGTGSWRTYQYQKRNGNLYPTHGLGPVAQYIGVNRGDRFDYMSSMSSPSKSRAIYGRLNFPADHKWNQKPFICGDINTSIIKTLRGGTIMVQWDEQMPRPYDRLNFVAGTKGAWGGFPNRCVVEGRSENTHRWDQGNSLQSYYEEFEHPLWKAQGNLAQTVGGHGGMDFLMMWRIIYCLRNGEPLDQDVYDAAAWSVIFPLSEWSVNHRSESVDIPDFTRGKWKDRDPLPVFDPTQA